jgi:hypothetical protein
MAIQRLKKSGSALGWCAGWCSGLCARIAGALAPGRAGRFVVVLVVCLAVVASAAPSSAAVLRPEAAARPEVAVGRAAALAARRVLVRRELSADGEQAAGRAAAARLRAVSKPPPARIWQIVAQDRRTAELRSAPVRGLSASTPSAGPRSVAAASDDVGIPFDDVVTGPGGADLGSCVETCANDSMVTPGEPVTVSSQIYNSSDPPVSEQVQVVFQQWCFSAPSVG